MIVRIFKILINSFFILGKLPPITAIKKRELFPKELLIEGDKISVNVNINGCYDNRYMEAVLKEINLIGKMQNRKIDLMHFSISCISFKELLEKFDSITNEIKKYFNIKDGITIPIRLESYIKGDIVYDDLKVLKDKGVKTLNIDGHSLNKYNKSDLEKLKTDLRRVGFKEICFLLNGKENGFSFEEVKSDCEIAFDIGADFFAIDEFKVLKNYKSIKERKAMLKNILDYRDEMGYEKYSGISFAKKQQNLDGSQEFFNFGLNARGRFSNLQIETENNIEKYIEYLEADEMPIKSFVKYSNRENMGYYFSGTIFNDHKINKVHFKNKFGKDIKKVLRMILLWWKIKGYITEDEDNIYITNKGIINFKSM